MSQSLQIITRFIPSRSGADEIAARVAAYDFSDNPVSLIATMICIKIFWDLYGAADLTGEFCLGGKKVSVFSFL